MDGISFNLRQGETLGPVGESGCGKTTTSKLILRLEQPTEGRILLEGRDIQSFKGLELQEYRTLVQAVFQDPWSSLSPRMRVRDIVAENVICVGGHFKIVASDIKSGRTLWTRQTSGPVNSSLAAAGDNLYVRLLDHRLLALDIKTGGTRCEFLTKDIITAAPVVAKGIVYIGSCDQYIYALDVADGNLIWKFRFDAQIHNSPVFAAGRLLVQTADGRVHAIE